MKQHCRGSTTTLLKLRLDCRNALSYYFLTRYSGDSTTSLRCQMTKPSLSVPSCIALCREGRVHLEPNFMRVHHQPERHNSTHVGTMGRRIGTVRRVQKAAAAVSAAATAKVAVEAATITLTDRTGYIDRGANSDPNENNSTFILQHSCRSNKRRRDHNKQTAFYAEDTSHVTDAFRSGILVSTSKHQLPKRHATSALLHEYDSSSSTSSSEARDCDELGNNKKDQIYSPQMMVSVQ